MKAVATYSALILVCACGIALFVMKEVYAPHETYRAEEKPVSSEPTAFTAVFFGDMMLDRLVRLRIEEFGSDYPFRYLSDILSRVAPRGMQAVIVNAEGVFTDNQSVTSDLSGRYLRFTFKPEWIPAIMRAGITHASQANNHTFDFGKKGYEQSMSYMKEYGLHAFGAPYNHGPVAYAGPLALIGYNQFAFGEDAEVHIARTEQVIEAESAKGYMVVVMPHWGPEYVRVAGERERDIARRFAEAGAAFIVGAHPHVIQDHETMRTSDGRNVPVYYSLGNFIFDQAFMPEVREGMTVALTVDADQKKILSIDTYIFDIREGQALPR